SSRRRRGRPRGSAPRWRTRRRRARALRRRRRASRGGQVAAGRPGARRGEERLDVQVRETHDRKVDHPLDAEVPRTPDGLELAVEAQQPVDLEETVEAEQPEARRAVPEWLGLAAAQHLAEDGEVEREL